MTLARRHIAIITPPTAGHIDPLVALGAALADRGARVSLVHMADVAAMMPASPVGFVPLDHPGDRPGRLAAHFRRLARPSGVIGLPQMIRSTATMTGLLLDALPAALRRLGADAVIADSVEPAGALVARHLRLPFVTAVTGLPLLREPDVPPPFLGWPFRPDAVGRHRNAGGYAVSDLLMRPITRLTDGYARRWGLEPGDGWSGRLQIAQCPAGLDFPRAALPTTFRYGAPWRLPTPAMAPLPPDDGRPLVFCSLGSLQGARTSLFAAMTRACAALGARALVAHGGGLTDAQAAALPGDPLVRAFWPQAAVLPHCSAAILHGGFNTVLDALAAGVPIVAVPLAFEQPATAARLKRIGAARVVMPADALHGALRPALGAVLADPSYRQAAARLGHEMAASGGTAEAAAAVAAALSADPAVMPAISPPPDQPVACAA